MWPYTNTEATLSRYAYVYMNEESTCTFVHMYVFMYNECIRYDVTCQVAVHGNYAGGEGEGRGPTGSTMPRRLFFYSFWKWVQWLFHLAIIDDMAISSTPSCIPHNQEKETLLLILIFNCDMKSTKIKIKRIKSCGLLSCGCGLQRALFCMLACNNLSFTHVRTHLSSSSFFLIVLIIIIIITCLFHNLNEFQNKVMNFLMINSCLWGNNNNNNNK